MIVNDDKFSRENHDDTDTDSDDCDVDADTGDNHHVQQQHLCTPVSSKKHCFSVASAMVPRSVEGSAPAAP